MTESAVVPRKLPKGQAMPGRRSPIFPLRFGLLLARSSASLSTPISADPVGALSTILPLDPGAPDTGAQPRRRSRDEGIAQDGGNHSPYRLLP
jgi:hypothetical protein